MARKANKAALIESDGWHCPLSSTGAHWWLIEPANGPESIGRCRFCHKERLFPNSVSTVFTMSKVSTGDWLSAVYWGKEVCA